MTLAETMFEAAEKERRTHDSDDVKVNGQRRGPAAARRFSQLPVAERDTWLVAARVARTEVMREIAATFETLLKVTDGDAEALLYRPGVQMMIESLRKQAA